MSKIKVLFVCIHNSARSQMAEAFLNHFGNGVFEAKSAGLEPGRLNPIVVDALKEIDIDISGNRTKTVDEFLDGTHTFDYVVTVCDESNAERCPMFPGKGKRLHWGFRDPSALQSSYDEKLAETKVIRDEIKEKIISWINSFSINVEVQYFNGCPHSSEALQNTKEALAHIPFKVNYTEILVETNELAKQIGFRGSPTILINDNDIENLESPVNPSLSCRVYNNGVPSSDFIKETIIKTIEL